MGLDDTAPRPPQKLSQFLWYLADNDRYDDYRRTIALAHIQHCGFGPLSLAFLILQFMLVFRVI